MKKQSSKSEKNKWVLELAPYDEYEIAIMDFGLELSRKLIEKYRKGREEHGGKPTSIDCQKEINLEILDILNYHLIEKVNTGRTVPRETPKKK